MTSKQFILVTITNTDIDYLKKETETRYSLLTDMSYFKGKKSWKIIVLKEKELRNYCFNNLFVTYLC